MGTMNRSPILSLFMGKKMRNIWHFLLIMIPNLISVVMEGASFGFILLAFSQYSGKDSSSILQKIPFFDRFIPNSNDSNPFQGFVFFLLVAIVLQALRSSLAFFTAYLTSNLALKIQTDAQTKVYEQILRLSFPCVNKYRIGDLAEYARTPSTFIAPFLDSLSKVISAGLMTFVALFLMFNISISLTIITLVLFILFVDCRRNR